MKLLFTIIIALCSASGFCQQAEFSFIKSTHKFPKAKEGEVLSHYFVFKNTGKAPLTINSYSVECSCTEVTFPSYPIAPGQTDSVRVTFNTRGKYYSQERPVILLSNARKKETTILFKVFVEPAKP